MDEVTAMKFWAALMNSRKGHASQFATSNSPGITEIVEEAIAQEFANSLVYTENVSLKDVISNPEDPPDCFGILNGRRICIELEELVDGEALAKAKKGASPYKSCGQFHETQWSRDRFLTKLNGVIDRKHLKYKAKNQVFDCLLIYTDEPRLNTHDVQAWLAETTVKARTSFKSVYLLMSYHPLQEHWPLFNIYGSLTIPSP